MVAVDIDTFSMMPDELAALAEDLKAFIINANGGRRHMTSGQLAMAMAIMYPEPRPGKKRGLRPYLDRAYLYRARIVLKHSLSEAQSVLAGSKPLNRAYQEAKAEYRLKGQK
jgi:hypothetical protein